MPRSQTSTAPASAQDVLAGLVERVTFHNADSGFCVLRVKARGRRDLATVVGHAAAIAAGEWVNAGGEWQCVAGISGVDARSPTRVRGYTTRTYSGRPRSSIRFSTPAAMATSVAWRPSVCDRSPAPITRFQREMSASTRARSL